MFMRSHWLSLLIFHHFYNNSVRFVAVCKKICVPKKNFYCHFGNAGGKYIILTLSWSLRIKQSTKPAAAYAIELSVYVYVIIIIIISVPSERIFVYHLLYEFSRRMSEFNSSMYVFTIHYVFILLMLPYNQNKVKTIRFESIGLVYEKTVTLIICGYYDGCANSFFRELEFVFREYEKTRIEIQWKNIIVQTVILISVFC